MESALLEKFARRWTKGERIAVHCVFALIFFIALVWRGSGIYPIVMADEFTHDKFSRLVPFAESPIPNYFYLLVYRLTNTCGDQFLGCARYINVTFFVAAAFFIHRVARLVCSRPIAALIVLFAIVSPMNSITVYYMAESQYFFMFWVMTWFVLRIARIDRPLHWGTTGVLLGLLALVKPHALFLVPAIAVYIAIVAGRAPDGGPRRALGHVLLFLAAFATTKFGLGYVFAGPKGITLFGPTYTALASAGQSPLSRIGALSVAVLNNMEGHLLALSLLFSLPVVTTVLSSKKMLAGKSAEADSPRIALYALLIFGTLIPIVCGFTASIAGIDRGDTLARIHMRYYDFVTPLLLILVASDLSRSHEEGRHRIGEVIAVACVAVFVLIGAAGGLATFTPSFVDSPQLLGLVLNAGLFQMLNALSLLSLGMWLWSTRRGAQIFLYLVMPIAIMVSGYFVNDELQRRAKPDVSDRAGLTARFVLSAEDQSHLAIIGSQSSDLYRALFQLDRLGPDIRLTPLGRAPDYSKLREEGIWALVFGTDLPNVDDFTLLPFDGFALVRSTYTRRLDFKASSWPGVIVRTRGLTPPEAWGTWSSGDEVELEFAEPLPKSFDVRLNALAWGPNVGETFTARVGQSTASFSLGAVAEDRVLTFRNDSNSRRLTISVPRPTALGVCADDDRKLGIGIVTLQVVRSAYVADRN